MKTILLMLCCLWLSAATAQKKEAPPEVEVESERLLPRKIDITIKVNGYTIRIKGDVSANPFKGSVKLNCLLTILGNETNLALPLVYSGSINRGPIKNDYELPIGLTEDDILIVETIVTRLDMTNPKHPVFVAE